MARFTGDLTAPLKLAIAGGCDFNNLLSNMKTAGVAEVGALPDVAGLILTVGIYFTSFPNDSFEP